MKTLYISLAAIVLQSLNLAFSQCPASSTIWNGTDNNISVYSGNYCFLSGTFTGTIDALGSNATIYVGPNAVFKPSSLTTTNLSGTMNLDGESVLPGLNPTAGFTLNVYKNTILASNVIFNNPYIRFIIHPGGSMLIENSILLGDHCSITNHGFLKSLTTISTQPNSTITNTGTFWVGHNFNPQGFVLNNGFVYSEREININNGAYVYNYCKWVAEVAFNNNNNSYFKNDGLVWVIGSFANTIIHNSQNATIEGGPNSIMQGVNFYNQGTVIGSGRYYFTDVTRQQGYFTGTSMTPIKFYDATLSGINLFDQEILPSIILNAVRQTVVPADTTGPNAYDCSQTILPVTITGFDAKAVNKKEVLVSWQTATEANTKAFVIERSDKPTSGTWQAAGTVNAAGFSNTARTYQFTDKAPLSGISYYRLRAVDVDGKITISTMKQVNLKEAATLQIYPNLVPKGGVVKVISSETLRYQLLEMSGKVLLSGTFSPGATVLPLNLKTGTYMIRTIGANQVSQHTKLIVQ